MCYFIFVYRWNRPKQQETKIDTSDQQREVEMETFLHKDVPKENGKAAEYTVIPLEELSEKYSHWGWETDPPETWDSSLNYEIRSIGGTELPQVSWIFTAWPGFHADFQKLLPYLYFLTATIFLQFIYYHVNSFINGNIQNESGKMHKCHLFQRKGLCSVSFAIF